MEIMVRSLVLGTSDRDRLASLLASAPASRRWAVEHRNAPLLCALGILDAPDVDYAHAAQRRFADPSKARGRALALIEELDRDDRVERYELWRNTHGDGAGRPYAVADPGVRHRRRRWPIEAMAVVPSGRKRQWHPGAGRSRACVFMTPFCECASGYSTETLRSPRRAQMPMSSMRTTVRRRLTLGERSEPWRSSRRTIPSRHGARPFQ